MPKKINVTLTETDILFLQDIFLTPGFHSIQLKDVLSGRIIIEEILASLPMHTSTACLTLENNLTLPNTVFDVYAALHTNSISEQAIEDFFINEFYFDCMWIEVSQKILNAPWYAYFCKTMTSYEQKTSIIKVF